LILALLLAGCTATRMFHQQRPLPVNLARGVNIVLSRPAPPDVEALAGGELLRDGGPVTHPELAIARAILRTNLRIAPAYALALATETARAAGTAGLLPEFFAATLLQESAYDPDALSSAGAIGIAQFMPDTAAAVGVDPHDPFAAIDASARLLGGYVASYRTRYPDPYAAALAAYNAGPDAVRRYAGVPPYPETRDYIALIYERLMRIAGYERMREE
jgi:soluble lytic murein transglycosylase-like protein